VAKAAKKAPAKKAPAKRRQSNGKQWPAQHVDFSQELFDLICERVADGESLRKVCAEAGMPRKATVMRWVAADETLAKQWALAMEFRCELYAEEIVALADEAPRTYMDAVKKARLIDPSAVVHQKNQVNARMWTASRLLAKKYGDRVAASVGGPDGKPLPSAPQPVLIMGFTEGNK
jgi:hypothetical protein